MIEMFVKLLMSHAVCDYPLQGDFLARGKNHKNPIPGIPWQYCLVNHAMIHALGVYLVTWSMGLAMGEFAVHCMIDWLKCDERINFHVDQWLHVACKGWWVYLASIGVR